MEREGKRYSAYASRHHISEPVMIDLISENDQSKFHSHQAISAPSRGRVLRTYRNCLIVQLHNHRESLLSLSVVPFDQESGSCPDFTVTLRVIEDLNRIS